VQRYLEPRRESLLGRQPIARGQAVAKIENDRSVRRGRRGADHQAQHGGRDSWPWQRVENPRRRAISSGPPITGRRIGSVGLPRRPP